MVGVGSASLALRLWGTREHAMVGFWGVIFSLVTPTALARSFWGVAQLPLAFRSGEHHWGRNFWGKHPSLSLCRTFKAL